MRKKSLISLVADILLKIMPSLEDEIILKRAVKNGCDLDGDVLRFYVQENAGIVQVLER